MTLMAVRMSYRIGRFETRAIVAATVLAVAVSAVVVNWLERSGFVACYAGGEGDLSVACLQLLEDGQWIERIARASLGLVPVFPFMAGIVLGVPVVARELDKGTARLAWSLSPSRLHWFLQRLLPTLAIVAACAFAVGAAAEWLVGAFAPGVDLGRSFVGFHSRGVLVMTSALLLASVGVLVGALVGRPLPAVLLSIVLGGLTLVAVTELHKELMKRETVPSQLEVYDEDDLHLEGRFQLPDGRLLTWDQIVAEDPSAVDTGPVYPFVDMLIPGSRYRAIEIREAAAHGALIVALLAAAGVVVARRRPG